MAAGRRRSTPDPTRSGCCRRARAGRATDRRRRRPRRRCGGRSRARRSARRCHGPLPGWARCRPGRQVLAVAVGAQRLVEQVDLDRAGQGEGDHQRRRGEVARPGQRMDAALEVAVARQHCRDDEVVALDRRRNPGVERSAVADARRAAVADDAEAELLERLEQAGALPRYSVTAREPGASEVLTVALTDSPRASALRASRPAPTITVGLLVLVHDVIAAIATEPWSIADLGRRHRCRPEQSRSPLGGLRKGVAEVGGQLGQPDLVLRPARAGDGRLDGRQVELERLVEVRPGTRLAPEAVLLGIRLDQRHQLIRPPGLAQVGERLGVDREERRRGAVLGRHVRDRGPVGQRERRQARRRRTRRTSRRRRACGACC